MKKVRLFILIFLGFNFSLNAQESDLGNQKSTSASTSRDITIKVRVYLEGALLDNNNEVGTTHSRPLMRDELRVSPNNSKRYIPDNDPYGPMSAKTWDGGNEKYNHVLSGLLPEFSTIPDPETVFGVTGENAITDWVFVELRSKLDYTEVISTRSGLVQRDGDVVDLDGVSGLHFTGTDVDDYFVVVRHRNHLGAMTSKAMTPTELNDLVDFTQASTGFFDFGSTKFDGLFDYKNLAQNGNVKNNYLTLWGGDFNGDGRVKYSSPNDDLNVLFGEVVGYEILDDEGNVEDYNYQTNYYLAFGYHKSDFNMDSRARYDNPNDDKNMIYGQIVFYSQNSFFDARFNFFIEQIPE